MTRARSAPFVEAPGVAAVLEATVAPLLAELRSLPACRRMEAGRTTRAAYGRVVQKLHSFHAAFERSLKDAAHLRGFDSPAFRREAALLRDLKLLGARVALRSSPSIDRFDSMARSWSRPPSVALVGALYVLERERKRAVEFAGPLAKALRVRVGTRCGLDYHLEGFDRAARRFGALLSWMDAHATDPDRRRELLEGAIKTAETLKDVFHELDAPA